MRKFRAVALLFVLIAVTLVVATSHTTRSTPPVALPSKPSASFYATPKNLAQAKPGEILSTLRLSPDGTAIVFAVLYRSTSRAGNPIAVSAIVSIPAGNAPSGGWPVLAYAHPLFGIGDNCAPSVVFGSTATDLPGDPSHNGYIVVATDYEGLGTEGIHPALVGASEAHSVLDSVRAVLGAPSFRARNEVVIWGESEGGHAGLFSAALAPTYAPELRIRGIVAAAPATNPELLFKVASTTPEFYDLLRYGALGYVAAYPNLQLSDVINPKLASSDIDPGCIFGGFGDRHQVNPIGKSPLDVPAWKQAIEENIVPVKHYQIPILIIQGDSDTLVSPTYNLEFANKLCAQGTNVFYVTVTGANHSEELTPTAGIMTAWSASVLKGSPTLPSTALPTRHCN